MTRELTPREEEILRSAAEYRAARRAYDNARARGASGGDIGGWLCEVIDSRGRLLSAAKADD